MYTLSIDTTHYTSVAISLGKKVIAHARVNETLSQSENLVSLLDKLMKENDIEYRDIDYIATTLGPGSFTGIRAGIATINAIKLTEPEIQLIGISNFRMLKHRAIKQVGEYDFIAAITGWLPNKCCIKVYDQGNAITFEAKVVDFDKVCEMLGQLHGNIVCVGEGLKSCYKSLSEMHNITILPRFIYADAKTISDIAYKYIEKQKFVEELIPFDLNESSLE